MTDYAVQFGRHIRYLREKVFNESIRPFARRVGLSPSYLGRIELGQVGVPRRSTVENIAHCLPGVDVATILAKAGYAPQTSPEETELDYIMLKLKLIDDTHIALAVDFIDFLSTKYAKG